MIGHILHRVTRTTETDVSGRALKRLRGEFEGIYKEVVDLTSDIPTGVRRRRVRHAQHSTLQSAGEPAVDDDVEITGEVAGLGYFNHRDQRPKALKESETPVAWRYTWHMQHPGARMCPGAKCGAVTFPKYVLSHTRSGAPQFTCNSMTCRNCGIEMCLTCGQEKGGGRGSGYHKECGRQPPWLNDSMLNISNDDPRVQRPPPLHPKS